MGSKLQRFKIIIKPDLSDASLHFINMSRIISDGLLGSIVNSSRVDAERMRREAIRVCEGYRICEGALAYFWNSLATWRAFAGLTPGPDAASPLTHAVARWKGCVDSLCPTSRRFVYHTYGRDGNFKIVVADLF